MTKESTSPEPGYEWEADELPPVPAAIKAEADIVNEPQSELGVLHGLTLDYTYSSGRHYQLTFHEDHKVTFAMPDFDMNIPDLVPVRMPYRSRVVRPGLILVHWLVKKGPIHVSLVIDLDQSQLHVSAMMPPNRWEFFDTATIKSINRA